MTWVCLVTVLYFGPTAPETPQRETTRVCAQVDRNSFWGLVRSCNGQGSDRCEVTSDDRGRFTVERKVRQ